MTDEKRYPISSIKQRDFNGSLSHRFNSDEMIIERQIDSFQITKPNGEVLHNFDIPVKTVLFYGRFLVFYETNSIFFENYTTLKFIDLQYASVNIGNAPLPVFSLPLKTTHSPESVKIVKGKLIVDKTELSHEQLVLLSQTQQILFNTSVALVDPETRETGKDLVNQIHEFYNKAMEAQSALFQEQMNQSLRAEELIAQEQDRLRLLGDTPDTNDTKQAELEALIKKSLEDGTLTDEEHKKISSALKIKQTLSETNNALYNGRRLSTRIRMLWSYLKQPRLEGALALQNTLLALATSKTKKEDIGRSWNLMRRNLADKVIKFGVTAIGATVAITVLPEAYINYLFQSTDLISATHEHFMGYLAEIDYGRNYARLSEEAFITSITGFTYFYSSYLADGQWTKFLWGLGHILLFPVGLFASIHFSVNAFKMVKGTSKQIKSFAGEQGSWFRALYLAAQKDKDRFNNQRAEAERKISGSDLNQITPKDVEHLEQEIVRINNGGKSASSKESKTERRKARLSGAYSKTIGLFKKIKDASTALERKASKSLFRGSYFEGLKDWISKQSHQRVKEVGGSEGLKAGISSLTNIGWSLKQFLLSSSSIRTTFKFNALLWNFFFIPRSFALNPKMWMMFFAYPNFFKETTKDLRSQRFPSEYNPGLYGWGLKARMAISTATPKSLSESKLFSKLFSKVLFSKKGLYQLRRFEAVTKKIEPEIIRFAIIEALKALMKEMDHKKIIKIFDSSRVEGQTTTGISSLYDKTLKGLSRKERTFFRLHFTRTYDTAMKEFWSRALAKQADDDMQLFSPDSNLGPRALGRSIQKALRAGNLSIAFTKDTITSLVNEAKENTNLEEIRHWAETATNSLNQIHTRVANNFKHDLLGRFNPANGALHRYNVVKTKVLDSNAIERATRAELASLKVSIPLMLIIAVGVYAAVPTGVLQPFDPEGLDTDTHYNYFSRHLFYSGFIPGVILSILANTWMKIQDDDRIDSFKGFDSTILFEDQRKGFWRFYLKNFFKNPKNKWTQNQIHRLKITISNLSAAATTILVTQLWGLGRIDVGIFLAMYIAIFVTPLSGAILKLDQAFELSKAWVSSRIPAKLRAHPKAQDFISKDLERKRMRFTVFNEFFGELILGNIAGDMLVLRDDARMGTRAFLRMVFGGETPTGLINNGLEATKNVGQKIPGLNPLVEIIRELFTNNYEAFDRYPKRLLELSVNQINRVIEDPNLPKHVLGEFLGKFFGATTTLGGFAAVPYAVSHIYEEQFKQRWLQRKGEEAQKRLSDAAKEKENEITPQLNCSGLLSNN